MEQTWELLPWAKRVQDILTEQGRNAAWLAKALDNMDHSQLSRLMHGQGRYKLREDLKVRIAKALGVPEYMIFGNNGHTPELCATPDEPET